MAYPDAYIPMHYSPSRSPPRQLVLASPPDEDWAETFAEWLNPRSIWKTHYAGLPVLRKLEYVEQLMHSLRGKKPIVNTREQARTLDEFTQTLGEFYRQKQTKHQVEVPLFYTRELTRLFSSSKKYQKHPKAARFLRNEKTHIRKTVARWTGQYEIVIDQYIERIIDYCATNDLYLIKKPSDTKFELLSLITAQATHNLATGKNWIVL